MIKKFIASIFPPTILRKRNELLKENLELVGKHQAQTGNLFTYSSILCNLCGNIFEKTGPIHSEFMACTVCNSIARDRVVIQCILHEISNRTGELHPLFRQTKTFKQYRLLECSPRVNQYRVSVLEDTLKDYVTSDYDMSAHRAGIKLDLTDDADVQPLLNSFDVIICAHVLEHIPEYKLALENIYQILAPGGFLVLQVPLLEAHYTSVTWDEFHGDNTRVFHRFGFDLLKDLEQIFTSALAVVGMLDFEITSQEISREKYKPLKGLQDRCLVLGEDLVNFYGLGSPDLCDAFIARKLNESN